MKRQQVISRFFAAKPGATSSAASAQNAPTSPKEKSVVSSSPKLSTPSSVKSSPAVNWPRSRGRRIPNPESVTSHSFSKKRPIDKVDARSILSSEELAEQEEALQLYAQKKRSRLVPRATCSSLLDGREEPLVISGPQSAFDIESRACASDLENLSTEYDQSDDVQESEDLVASCDLTLSPEREEFSEQCAKTCQGTQVMSLHPTPLQSRSPRDYRAEIPPSDPVKHKLFVQKLFARIDEKGEVKKSWYGSPPTGKEKLTPLEVQVVELQTKYPDVLLMVEVGYRYRFFGNDAETAGRILGICPHYDHSFLTASIPTFRLHFHVRRLVAAGFKVGVVRQTETAAIKAHGSNKAGPFTRGLSALYTKSTIEAAEDLGGGRTEGNISRLSSYLMCVAERPIQTGKSTFSKNAKLVGTDGIVSDRDSGSRSGSYDTEFGVVAVEAATGDVMFGSFKDTVVRTELESCLMKCAPAELLLAAPLSSTTDKLLMGFAGPSSEVRVERVSRDCFKDGGALAEVLEFYTEKDDTENPAIMEAEAKMSENGLEVVMRMPDLVVQALALALRYLKQFNLERVLRLGAVFRPFSGRKEMNLSPNALRQLEILNNNTDGKEKGSLLWLMNNTQTAFGARLLRYWVTHPLCDSIMIAARLDAVTEIAKSIGSLGHCQIEGTFPGSGRGGGVVPGWPTVSSRSLQQNSIGGLLRSMGRMPDLERGLTRIFHRTATAAEFVTVMQALITAAKHLQRFQVHEHHVDTIVEEGTGEEFKKIKSSLLQRLVSAISSTTLYEHANHLMSAINTDAASAGDKLKLFSCTDGRFPEVAKCRLAIKAAEKELDGYLPGFRKLLRIPKLEYMTVNVVSHLVEVSAAQRVPENWMKVSSTKKTTRYHPPEVLQARDKLTLAQEELGVACIKAWDVFLAEFASHYVDFRASVQALAALDCLYSLAVLSRNQGYVRPEFVEESELSQFMIQSGCHPILDSTLQDAFVPNDTFLGGPHERCQIITGPNMGGKSCYIRQVALMAIMAQVGSYVPASSAKLHVFDSVQTRMGASDSLQKGSSTFFEELSETSTILSTATCRSLVILDELGRGTSTHDGVAIAYATLHYLLKETKCLTLFVTHYPKIAELKDEFPGEVNPYYVSYMAQKSGASNEVALDAMEGVDDTSEDSETITFLYKLVPGVASKSFGLHVARLAQIPEACVLRAATMAAEFEKAVSNRNKLKVTSDSVERTPDKLALVDCRDATRSFCEGESNDRTSFVSRDATRHCVDVGTYKEITFDDKAVRGNSVDDFGELGTVEIEDTKLAISCFENTVEKSSKPTSSSPAYTSIDDFESASVLDGADVSWTEKSKVIAESELRGLLLSIEDALKPGNESEISMALLMGIQKQGQAPISS